MAFKLPQIPSVPAGIDPSVNRVLTSLRTFAQALPKYIAQQAKATATSEVKKSSSSSGGGSGGGGGGVPDPGLPGTPGGHPTELPTVPTNLAAAATFSAILLTWDGAVYQGSDYAIIYRGVANDFQAAFDKGSIGQTSNNLFTDHPPVEAVDQNTGAPQVWWYFVVFVNKNGVSGTAASISAALVSDPAYVLSVMTDALINASPLYNSLKSSDPKSLAGIHSNITDPNATTSDGTQYHFIKTDVNGHVAGYGLYNTGTTAQFIILADQFAVAATGVADKVPFIVDTAKSPAQIGINGDLIVNGTISGNALVASTVTADKISITGGLSTLSVDTGTLISGVIRSSNWNGFQGSYFDLTNGNMYLRSQTPEQGASGQYDFIDFSPNTGITISGKLSAWAIDAVSSLNIRGNGVSYSLRQTKAGSGFPTWYFTTHGGVPAGVTPPVGWVNPGSITHIVVRFIWVTDQNTTLNMFIDGNLVDVVGIGGGGSSVGMPITMVYDFPSTDNNQHSITFSYSGVWQGDGNYVGQTLEVMR